MTAEAVSCQPCVLCVGDTTYLDYRNIIAKREGYGPQGRGGNGLLLHSALAVDPDQGQPLGLLWQKLWNREHRPKPSADESPEAKKLQQAEKRKAQRAKAFEEKESYRWVEAMAAVASKMEQTTRVIHVFDREGDIAEVFAHLNESPHLGAVVRAAHNRRLTGDPLRLWEKLTVQPLRGYHEVALSETQTRKARTAMLEVRFCLVHLQAPPRLGDLCKLPVQAVYAREVDCPSGEDPLSWMLLTSEGVSSLEDAQTILRWYGYRWRVEEFHKLLKSGCQAERYRLAAEGMKPLLGFLSVIAADLLRLTYLQRTAPEDPVTNVLTTEQVEVLVAKAETVPQQLTVGWAVEAVARLGGYLEHRRKTAIGIQVLWRGWSKLHDLLEGWRLARQT